MAEVNNNSKAEKLHKAFADLSSNNSIEGFEAFLHEYADGLDFNGIKEVRSLAIAAMNTKKGRKLSGNALRVHVEKCRALTESISDLLKSKSDDVPEDDSLIDIRHLHALAKKAEQIERRKREAKLAESRKVKGEKTSHFYRGGKIEVVEGVSGKGKEILQVIAMHKCEVPGVKIGVTYLRDSLPDVLLRVIDPEAAEERDAERRAKEDAKMAAKKRGSGKGEKNDKKKREKGKKISKEEKKKLKKAA